MKQFKFFSLTLTTAIISLLTIGCSKKTIDDPLPQTHIIRPLGCVTTSNGYFSIKTPNGFSNNVTECSRAGFHGYVYKYGKSIGDTILLEFKHANYLNTGNIDFSKITVNDSIKNYYKSNGDSVLNIERPAIKNAQKAVMVTFLSKKIDSQLDLYVFNDTVILTPYETTNTFFNSSIQKLNQTQINLIKQIILSYQFIAP
ncbi:MAG TPA: hypothetical protein PK772_03185 [Chitinophagaceae bacterium]|nr:hypothetical protein [Chitinophagaceae bacterium]